MKIEHFAFNMPDVLAAVPWYIEHCGFRLVRAIPDEPYIHFVADASGILIEFYSNHEIHMPDYQGMNPREVHIAFVVDDMEGEIGRLLAAGATIDEPAEYTPNGDLLAFLRDPWGFPLQLAHRGTPLA